MKRRRFIALIGGTGAVAPRPIALWPGQHLFFAAPIELRATNSGSAPMPVAIPEDARRTALPLRRLRNSERTSKRSPAKRFHLTTPPMLVGQAAEAPA